MLFIASLLSALTLTGNASTQEFSPATHIDQLPPIEAQTHHVDALYEEEEPREGETELLFDPEGTERLYCMSFHNYNKQTGVFGDAISVMSRVRFAADGKTVYFKDLAPSANVDTWLYGTQEGDTIYVPFGQTMAYYYGYEVFFCPMIYDANGTESGLNLEATEYFKLVIHGDSIYSPYDEEALIFPATTAYVYVDEENHFPLSIDVCLAMREEHQTLQQVPEGAVVTDYSFRYRDSYDNVTLRKVKVARDGQDLYMQLSVSCPDSYVHGVIQGDRIRVEGNQLVTDSTFLNYFSLCAPVYEGGKLTDFTPLATCDDLRWDEATQTITSPDDLMAGDFMDGGMYVREYISNPTLTPYPGDHPAKPGTPIIRAVQVENTIAPFICFILPNVDTDSCVINTDLVTYNLLFDEEVYVFSHADYRFLPALELTDIPFAHSDSYDFYCYNRQLWYLYFYEDLYTTVGIQSIYTVDGVATRSDIAVFDIVQGDIRVIPCELNSAIEDRPLRQSRCFDLMGRQLHAPVHGQLMVLDGRLRIVR